MHILMGEMRRAGIFQPNITRTGLCAEKLGVIVLNILGNKLFEVLLKRRPGLTPHISFRDSFNWMSLKLEELPKTLGLSVEDKGFFCHGWNYNRNMNLQLDGLPPRELYYPESMQPKRREEFNRWYYENEHSTRFLLREQIRLYCEQDVRVLAHAVLKFRQLFFALATDALLKDDVIATSLTLASACNRHFCRSICHLKFRSYFFQALIIWERMRSRS